jgi:hypothetical protein
MYEMISNIKRIFVLKSHENLFVVKYFATNITASRLIQFSGDVLKQAKNQAVKCKN